MMHSLLWGAVPSRLHHRHLPKLSCCVVGQVDWARRQYYGLLSALRPDAVGLVDGLGLTDYLLNSALGRADGDVYRALLAAAQVSHAHVSYPLGFLDAKPVKAQGWVNWDVHTALLATVHVAYAAQPPKMCP